MVDSFRATALPSLGIYAESPDLDRIFQQAKFLQRPLQFPSALVHDHRRTLEEDKAAAAEYRFLNELSAAITSWLAVPHLIEEPGSATEVAVFPASRSPEGDFVRAGANNRAGGGSDVALLREMAAAIREGKLSLKPEKRAGWYDRRLWALEPLIKEQGTLEEPKLSRGPEYVRACEDTFVGLLTRRRETHVKQLEMTPESRPVARKPILVWPVFRIEPQPTVYRRTSESYAWLKRRLGELGGPKLLDQPAAAGGPGAVAARTVGELLTAGERIYRHLERVSLADLGLGPELAGAESRASDLFAGAYDPRVVVPFAFDVAQKRYRCAAIVGVRVVEGQISYAKTPQVTVRTLDGKRVDPRAEPVTFESQPILLAVPVVEEALLARPLTRAELRKLCDENQTHAKIREALR
jgi:hypothetical protein